MTTRLFEAGVPLPQTRDAVLIEDRIGAHQRKPFHHRLHGEQAVERVAVMHGQSLDHRGVGESNRQQLEIVPGNLAR